MVIWDDKAPYNFLVEYGNHSRQHELICAAAADRLLFLVVPVNDIIRKSYKLHPKRIKMWNLRYQAHKEIGTLFVRPQIKHGKQKWFLKDGNHRFIALIANGEEEVRIAYDPENRV